MTITSKSGKEIVLRPPKLSDVKVMMDYVNELVEEDVMVLINEKQDLEQERKYVEDSLKAIGEGKKVQLLGFDGEVLVGNTQVELGRWKESHVGTLGISISKTYRGEGVGLELSKAVIELACEELEGLEVIKLDVFEANKPAIGLYKKLGFVEYGLLPEGIKHHRKNVGRAFMYKRV